MPIFKVIRPPINLEDAKRPEVWRTTGRRLMNGARLVWPELAECLQGFKDTKGSRTDAKHAALSEQSGYFAPFYLLAGFAVENELKARILESRIRAGAKLETLRDVMRSFRHPDSKRHRHHDLVTLAELADVTLGDAERNLLTRLTVYTQWASRYQFPVHENEADFRRTIRDRDLREIEAFILKLQRTNEVRRSHPER